MTITIFEEQDETAAQLQSEPSSPIPEQQELTGPTDLFHEMKYEMRAAKGSPSTTTSLHDRLKTGLSTNPTASSANPSPLLCHSSPSSVNKLRSHTLRNQSSPISPVHDRLKTTLSNNLATKSVNPSTLLLHSPPSNADRLSSDTSRGQTSILTTHLPGQSITAHRHQLSVPSSKSGDGALGANLTNRQYEKDAPKNPTMANSNPRPVSIDTTNIESVLPERTRLRRQRRMGSQNSTDEDPMERLNKLRARISGALSEVKGVLNKYSTETEPKNDVPEKEEKISAPPLETQEKGAPVQFRFVKKVRRRSVFSEDDEIEIESNQGSIGNENRDMKEGSPALKTIEVPIKGQGDNTDLGETGGQILNRSIIENNQKPNEVSSMTEFTQSPSKMDDPNIDTSKAEILVAKVLEPKETSRAENQNNNSGILTEELEKNKLVAPTDNKKRRVSIGTVKEVQNQLIPQDIKTQRRPSDSAAIFGKFSKNLPKSAATTGKAIKAIPKTIRKEKEEIKADIPKTEIEQPTEGKDGNQKAITKTLDICSKNNDAILKKPQEVIGAPTKQIPVKKTDNLRRSSIAAVERSRMDPPERRDEWTTQRRPSDSGTIMKNAKTTTPNSNKKKTETKTNRSSAPPSNSAEQIPLIVKNADVSNDQIESKCKDDAMTPSAVGKQHPMMMPIQSINVIDNETSLPSALRASAATPLSSSFASALGRATKALANAIGTVISPSAKKTQCSVVASDSQIPLISDGRAIVNVAVPLNLSQTDASSSHQALPDSNPTVQRANKIGIVPLEKGIPPSTGNAENKNNEFEVKQEAPIRGFAASEQFVDPLKAAPSTLNSGINHTDSHHVHQEIITQTIKTTSSPSLPLSPPRTSSTLSSLSVSSSPPPLSEQQVAVNSTELADDIRVHDRVPEIIETTSKKSLSEVNVEASSKIAAIPKISATNNVATKASVSLVTTDSDNESIAAAASSREEKPHKNMPELQVLPTPVKAIEIQPQKDSEAITPFGESKDAFPKKKIVVKKVVRKGGHEKLLATKAIPDDNEPKAIEILPGNDTTNEIKEAAEVLYSTEDEHDQQFTPAASPSPKQRKVKKKVIIKRLQRRLSGSEQTFFINSSDEKPLHEVETIERAIAYVTDDEFDDLDDHVESNTPAQHLKSCVHLREYQVGDWVMYAERYKKTQIRWKKGRIIERITSISYKVDIDGREVSTHIKDLKKYTGRKVRFGDKEYLEIDYEQIAVEEVKARTYSIWNMV